MEIILFYILCGWMSETDAKKFQKEIESDADTFCIMEDKPQQHYEHSAYENEKSGAV